MRKIQRYGWKPDLPDPRDDRFDRTGVDIKLTDWSLLMPPCYDQQMEGSCTAHALVGAVQFWQGKQGLPLVMPSRNFLYYNERAIEGQTDNDSGAMIRDGIKSLIVDGVCPESEWPYEADNMLKQPPQRCYDSAQGLELESYERVDNTDLNDLLAALSVGPVCGGFSVPESFESPEVAKTGIVPMPGPNEVIVGGHAVLTVFADWPNRLFKVRNSWGTGWGQNGYFWVPFDFWTDPDLADDYWLLKGL